MFRSRGSSAFGKHDLPLDVRVRIARWGPLYILLPPVKLNPAYFNLQL